MTLPVVLFGHRTSPGGLVRFEGSPPTRMVYRFVSFFGLVVMMMMMICTDDCAVDGLTLAPIYWNSSNPLFKPSTKGHVIQVQPRDDIDFVCPHYFSNDSKSSTLEYFVIFQVSRAEYENCAVSQSADSSISFVLLNCNAPHSKKRFTVIFDPFQAVPNVPEYRPGVVYYFISAKSNANGDLSVDSCASSNMKLAVYVCCSTDSPTSTLSTTTITLPPPSMMTSLKSTRPSEVKVQGAPSTATPIFSDITTKRPRLGMFGAISPAVSTTVATPSEQRRTAVKDVNALRIATNCASSTVRQRISFGQAFLLLFYSFSLVIRHHHKSSSSSSPSSSSSLLLLQHRCSASLGMCVSKDFNSADFSR